MKREEYAEQVMTMSKSLYYITCSLLPVMADREDALQNTIVKGLSKCEALRDKDKLRPWVTRILINECYSILRSKKRLVLFEEIPNTAHEAYQMTDLALRDAVLALPESKRIPLTMSLEGYTVREIAQALRVPEGTVKTRLRDAKLKLRDTLTDSEEVLA